MINTVAVVSGGSPDYLIDIVADGMVRLLGRENVHVEFSWSRPGAAENRIFRHLYSLTLGSPNKIPIPECEALIASVRVPLAYIQKSKEAGSPIVAIVDGEDTGELKSKYLKVADVYFKREYYENGRYPVRVVDLPRGRRFVPTYSREYPEKVLNLSFAIVPSEQTPNEVPTEKTGDVFFAGNVTSEIRAQLKEMVTRAGYTYLSNVLGMDKYVQEVRRHWICIAPRGSGWDTYRYWEIPYLGSVLLCQKHPLKIDDDFAHGKSCLRFSTAEEAKTVIDEFLPDKQKLLEIGTRGKNLVMEKHLSIHRAMKVFSALNSCG